MNVLHPEFPKRELLSYGISGKRYYTCDETKFSKSQLAYCEYYPNGRPGEDVSKTNADQQNSKANVTFDFWV